MRNEMQRSALPTSHVAPHQSLPRQRSPQGEAFSCVESSYYCRAIYLYKQYTYCVMRCNARRCQRPTVPTLGVAALRCAGYLSLGLSVLRKEQPLRKKGLQRQPLCFLGDKTAYKARKNQTVRRKSATKSTIFIVIIPLSR